MYLAGMIGAFLGLRLAIVAVFCGTLLAIAYGLVRKKQLIPFGPFIAGGALVAYLFGNALLRRFLPFFTVIP
jgi:leader peptidase (prepilin peptidase)/N-methyltransferase